MSKVIDMTGKKFGYWEVLERAGSDKRGQALWRCRCVCGNEKNIVGSTLRNGTSTNCGCIKAKKAKENNGTFVNELGNRYGKLVVIAKDEELSAINHRAYWVCQCDCGNVKSVSSKCLRDGKTKSCGCLISYGEELVTKALSKKQCIFKSQYCVNIENKIYRFDFALYKNGNVVALIEFHGIQHYDTNYKHWGKDVSTNQERDYIKTEWAKENNIPLYIIPYWDIDKVEEKIEEIIKNIISKK